MRAEGGERGRDTKTWLLELMGSYLLFILISTAQFCCTLSYMMMMHPCVLQRLESAVLCIVYRIQHSSPAPSISPERIEGHKNPT